MFKRALTEQFCDIDLAAIVDLPGYNDGLSTLSNDERRHWLKVFALIFGLADP